MEKHMEGGDSVGEAREEEDLDIPWGDDTARSRDLGVQAEVHSEGLVHEREEGVLKEVCSYHKWVRALVWAAEPWGEVSRRNLKGIGLRVRCFGRSTNRGWFQQRFQ